MRYALAFALIAVSLMSSTASAQSQRPATRVPVPPAEKLVLLIRLSLLTLNDALQTGNYTVLRDRASPSFHRNNTAAGLGRSFAKLEAQGLDLAAVAILTPQLSVAEVVGAEQRLHLTGHFPGQTTQINFDLTFEPTDGHWKLFALSVGEAPVQATNPTAQKPPGPSASAKSPATKAAKK